VRCYGAGKGRNLRSKAGSTPAKHGGEKELKKWNNAIFGEAERGRHVDWRGTTSDRKMGVNRVVRG